MHNNQTTVVIIQVLDKISDKQQVSTYTLSILGLPSHRAKLIGHALAKHLLNFTVHKLEYKRQDHTLRKCIIRINFGKK